MNLHSRGVTVQNPTRIMLFGKIRAGKDFVADRLSIPKHNLARPFYWLINNLIGNTVKGNPGMRRTMQEIGQWGRGIINEQYPVTTARISFVNMVRKLEGWESYGEKMDFWAHKLCQSPEILDLTKDLVVTDCRYLDDSKAIEKYNVEPYLVLCYEETRKSRIDALGEKYDGIIPVPKIGEIPKYDLDFLLKHTDISEVYATYLSWNALYSNDLGFSQDRIIWNDENPMPAGKKFLTVESFLERHGKFIKK